jgi:hypothetical protein
VADDDESKNKANVKSQLTKEMETVAIFNRFFKKSVKNNQFVTEIKQEIK